MLLLDALDYATDCLLRVTVSILNFLLHINVLLKVHNFFALTASFRLFPKHVLSENVFFDQLVNEHLVGGFVKSTCPRSGPLM